MTTRILIADDHQVFREGLRRLLEAEDGLAVVGEAENGRDAVERCEHLKPDVVIMDITMPSLNGIEATRQVRSSCPETRVLALSMHSDRRFVHQMFAAGASGFLLKEGAFEELARAIRVVREGQTYISPSIADLVINEALTGTSGARVGTPSSAVLSPREREVLQLIAEGQSTKQIAGTLHVGVKTVETHRRQIMIKLGLNGVAELTKYAIKEGLTTL